MKRFSIILVLVACGTSAQHQEENEEQDSDSTSFSTSTSKMFVSDDEFVFGALENELLYNHVKAGTIELARSIVPNKFVKSESDTIINLKSTNDYFTYYVSKSNTILMEASIKNSNFKLSRGLHVGVNASILSEAFRTEGRVDTLIVKDFENTSYFMFLIENEKLREIQYKSRFID